MELNHPLGVGKTAEDGTTSPLVSHRRWVPGLDFDSSTTSPSGITSTNRSWWVLSGMTSLVVNRLPSPS